MALQEVVHILRNAGRISTVLAHSLPKREQEVGTVFVLEQEIDFVNEDEGIFALCTILCNAVEDGIQNHQHPDGHKLLAEVKDVVADEPVIGIHIGVLGKGVQRAVGKQLDGKGAPAVHPIHEQS